MKPDLVPVRESWAGRGLWAPARPGASVCIARPQDHVTTAGRWWLGRGLCSPELGCPESSGLSFSSSPLSPQEEPRSGWNAASLWSSGLGGWVAGCSGP